MAPLLIAMALGAPGAALDLRVEINLRDAAIRIADVVPSVRGEAGAIEIARLPAGRSSMPLSRAAVAALVRRAVPGMELAEAGAGLITFRRAAASAPSSPCFVTRKAVAVGEAVGSDDVVPGACGVLDAPVRYDARTGSIVAARRIEAGEPIGRALPRSAPDVAGGEALTLISRSGPVTVERRVAALQAGRRGGRVFVRAEGGRAFAVPVGGQRP